MTSRFAAYPRTFWLLVAGTLVNRIGLLVLPFLSLFLTAERGMSVQTATLLVGLHGAGAFAAGVAGGMLADRVGRKAVLVASLGGGAVLMLAIPHAPGVVWLGATVAAYGFVGEMYRPAVSALVADTVEPARHARAFALLYWAINVGAAVGPALGGALAGRSFGLLFAVDAATMAVYALVVAVGVREARPAWSAHASADDAVANDAAGPARSLGDALRDERLLALTFVSFAVGTAFVQSYVTLPLVMRADGISPGAYGAVIALNGAIVVLLSLPAARWVEAHGGSGTLAASVVLIGAGVGAYAFADAAWEYAVGVVVLSLGEIACLPVFPALVARLAPDGLRGTYQGVHQSGWGLAHMVSPVVGGLALATLGADALWAGGFVLCLLAAALIAAYGLGD